MSVVAITKDNFTELVKNSDKPVLLDFYATWCGPCRMVSPIVEQIAEERSDVLVGKVDVDAQTELAAAFEISSIPTLIVVKGGIIANAKVGFAPKAETVLEINLNHPIAETVKKVYTEDKDKAAKYAKVLYGEACLIGGVALDDPKEFTALVSELMV